MSNSDLNLEHSWREITERNQTEELLHQQIQFSDDVINSLPGIFYMLNLDGRFIRVNHRFLEVTGYTKDELDHMLALDLFDGEDKNLVAQKMREAFETGESSAEAACITKSGRKIPYSFTGCRTPIDGRFYLVGIGTDITERKQQEENTHRLMKEMETILRNALVGIVYLKQRRIFSCNRRLEEIFGYGPGELIGETTERLYDTHETFVGVGERAYADLDKNNSYNEEVVFKKKDGSLFWGALNGCAIDSAHPHEGSIWIYADISARRKAEMDLEESRERFDLAVRGSSDGIWDWNIETGETYVSERWCEMLGYLPGEISFGPKGWTHWIHPDDRTAAIAVMREHFKTGKPYASEYRMPDKHGEYHWFLNRGQAIWNAQGRAIRVAGSTTDITERKQAEEEINLLAFYDPLTQLPNRRLLLDRLKQALVSSVRNGRYGAVLYMDLDNFKTLNDTLGHEIGDLLLQQVAERLATCVREGDTVARLGGDEFVVMLEDLSESAMAAAAQAESVGDKVLNALNQPYQLASYTHRGTTSIGITLFSGQQGNIDELLKRADMAMYQAKAAGRNTIRFFDPEMQAAVTTRAALEEDLREAVQKGQFSLHYQAQVLSDGRLTGAEVLLRWKHPERGMVPPAEFISLAEDTGLILPLGHWVLQTACSQLALWAAQPQMAHLTVAVNVSARQFRHQDFVDQVIAVLEHTGANPQRLKLELTESLLVDDVEDIIAKMTALKTRGVGFSLDDFGTGYSSLSYLKRLPLDQLKIDRGFVRDILTDPNDAAIAKMVVALAGSMGLAVIAEGVEIETQRDFLSRHGCHAYQGYLFSRPLPLEEFEAFVKQA